jgi:hypothetical protein
MNPNLEAIFDEPDSGYLKPEALNALSQFVSSLPERLSLYRRLRNEEITLMQPVADALETRFPDEPADKLKRSLQNAILMVRYVAMAVLTDDASMVTKRLESWLPDIVTAYDTRAIDLALYGLIREQFAKSFAANQMALLTPGLDAAQALISGQPSTPDEAELTSETLVGLF